MQTTKDIALETWSLLGEMAPYLLFGFLIAGVLSILLSRAFVQRHLGRSGLGDNVKATLLGIPMPLCSCSVIPVAASLRERGAARGSTISFLTSTPQTGVDSVLATYALMGPLFAVVRVVAAFVTGIAAGLIVDSTAAPEKRSVEENKADDTEPAPAAGIGQKLGQALRYGFISLPHSLMRPLLIGLVLGGVLSATLPADAIADYVTNTWLTFGLITLVAVPLYVCSVGSIPLAFALMSAGVTPGAALVFLITGPATNTATFSTLWKYFGLRSTLVYLVTLVVFSWALGWGLDQVYAADIREQMHQHDGGLPEWLKTLGAVALLTVFAFSWWRNRQSSNTSCCHSQSSADSNDESCCAHREKDPAESSCCDGEKDRDSRATGTSDSCSQKDKPVDEPKAACCGGGGETKKDETSGRESR